MNRGDYIFAIGMFILGTVFGLFLMWTYIPDIEKKHLNEVGIDHIEKCHNVQSNWSEIVWIKDVKKEGNN